MDPVIPAEGSGVQNAEGTAPETPQAAVVDTPAGDVASQGTQPSESQPTKPDLATILSDAELRQAILKDPEFRREFFKHPDPETQAEMEHRVASEAGRRAKAELDKWQQQEAHRQAAEQARQERERLKGMDEYELGQQYKQQLEQQEAEEALQQRLQPLLTANIGQLGQRAYAKLSELAKEAGLTDLNFLLPHQYNEYEDFLTQTTKTIAKAMAEKELKAKLPVEKQAWLEEHSAGERGQASSPTVLPAGETSMSNDDFLAAYAAGKTNDHKRAMQLLGR